MENKSKVVDESMVTEFKKGYNSYFESKEKGNPIYELTVVFEGTPLLVKQYNDLVDVIKVAASHLANGAGTEITISCFIPNYNEDKIEKTVEEISKGAVVDGEIVE